MGFQEYLGAGHCRRPAAMNGLPKSSGSRRCAGHNREQPDIPLPRRSGSANPPQIARSPVLVREQSGAPSRPVNRTRPFLRAYKLLAARKASSASPPVPPRVADCCKHKYELPAGAIGGVCAHRQWPQGSAPPIDNTTAAFHAGLDLSGCGGLLVGSSAPAPDNLLTAYRDVEHGEANACENGHEPA